ncbi:carbamoyltransferase N-terminal domain-containing protein [Bradyrhizobium sp. CIAT3101]|uniref:nodulation protein NodU n=1 Tax=Bradyrhizobium sp. CIAT3101 TaxID=439387 RepID=UPI0024B0D8D7|nr:nodulation protein NodU [Bradyrhizobium sp. CIAT3101]WFU80444.1 carbamoyltransferase N-terminal domain-containing protein [Bradyrhizobium sp. CIAT3101]
MRICGIKLTHDGSVALVEDGRLVFCIEQEKRENNRRYQTIENLDAVVLALAEHGLDPRDIDQFVIDGWDGETESEFQVLSGADLLTLKGAPYVERPEGLLSARERLGLVLNGKSFSYRSYAHVTGHVASAYCTSPFAKAGEPAFCLVWDGCIFPRLYYVDASGGRFLESLFPMIGHAYAVAGHHFGPYQQPNRKNWDLGVAGKLMAYIGLGAPDEDIVTVFKDGYEKHFAANTEAARRYRANINDAEASLAATHDYFGECALRLDGKRAENILASFHVFLERLLVSEMGLALLRHSNFHGPRNLCVAGGCGLNIKWNSALRASGLFEGVWVPPFPNDSGSAIGAACSAMVADKGFVPLEWSVYSGPSLTSGDTSAEWGATPCNISELAALLATNKPVVFLAGRAELGPRALGGRSILAAATSPAMKDYLNDIKIREHFRPVAPICLEDRAPEIFDPGTPDPYMLFDHQTRPEWRDKIPAVVHLDGSARLQTVGRTSGHKVAELLIEYEKLTGIPLLCNTSANHHGRGFFPDVAAACEWGRIEQIWCDGLLWSRRPATEASLSDRPAEMDACRA